MRYKANLMFAVFNDKGRMIAKVEFANDAMALVSRYEKGIVKARGRVVWNQVKDRARYLDPIHAMTARLVEHDAARLTRLGYNPVTLEKITA